MTLSQSGRTLTAPVKSAVESAVITPHPPTSLGQEAEFGSKLTPEALLPKSFSTMILGLREIRARGVAWIVQSDATARRMASEGDIVVILRVGREISSVMERMFTFQQTQLTDLIHSQIAFGGYETTHHVYSMIQDTCWLKRYEF